MKMLFKPEHVTQFGLLMLTCHPKVMQSLLSILNGLHNNSERTDAKYTDGPCHMFRSGAKLSWRGGSIYSIYCYAYNGKDGLSAVAELRMAFNLRNAERQFRKMKELSGSDMLVNHQHSILEHSIAWVHKSQYPQEV